MSVRHQPGRHGDGLRSERGSAAMLAAVGMALLLVITLSFVSLAQLETKIGVNRVQAIRAIQAAEAGARRVYRDMVDGSDTAQGWLNQTQPVQNSVAVDSPGTARYTVRVVDNSATSTGPDTDNIVVIQSTGAASAAQSTVQLFVQPGVPFAANNAIQVNNYLLLKKTPKVQGNCGRVHVADNARDAVVDIDMSAGTPYVVQGITTNGQATGDYYKTTYPPSAGATQVPITVVPSAQPVPPINPKRYAKYADYFLNDNGYAYRWQTGAVDVGTATWCATTPCGDPPGWIKLTPSGYTPGNCILGWQRNKAPSGITPAEWAACNAADGFGSTPGTFYVRGDAKVGNTASSSPYKVTIIAEGAIQFTAWSEMHWDDLTTSSSPASINPRVPQDLFLVAGTDISIPGGTSYVLTGGILAHEQISMTGSSRINGFILAEDANAGSGLAPSNMVTSNLLSDTDFQITYNCGAAPPELSSPPVILRWSAGL